MRIKYVSTKNIAIVKQKKKNEYNTKHGEIIRRRYNSFIKPFVLFFSFSKIPKKYYSGEVFSLIKNLTQAEQVNYNEKK